ncbi:MAG: hypothetical protein AAFQ41_07645 [Cyanobacteria bacterium J06623_7]
MKFTYRGVGYKSPIQDGQAKKSVLPIPVDKCGAPRRQNFDRLISIVPLNYYTYRGVSYTKTLVSDTWERILLDIARQ